MGKLIDLKGQRFGKLTVLERDFNHQDKKRAYWNCKCDCGAFISVRGDNLRNGHTKSCGCLKEKQINKSTITEITNKKTTRYKDYSGQKIGRLLILNRNFDQKDKKRVYWNCLCDCGNICIKRSDSLTSVNVPSCGCYKKEQTSKQWSAQLVGQHFGKLTVLEKIEHDGVRSLWKCQCDCGNICYYPSRYLLAMNVQSCGCETRSKGELELRQLLTEKNILFKEQYSFKDCLSQKGYPLRFDFVILDFNNNVKGIIEFNGEQHYKPIEYFGGIEKFLEVQTNDRIKQQYCFQHNIPFLIIPYTELGNINIDEYIINII